MLGAESAGKRPVPEETQVFHHGSISTRNLQFGGQVLWLDYMTSVVLGRTAAHAR